MNLADLLFRLRRGLKLEAGEEQILSRRLTPTILLDDLTQPFSRSQSAERPWAAGSFINAVAAQRSQVQVQVLSTAQVVTVIDYGFFSTTTSANRLLITFRARDTAALSSQIASRFVDRRGVVETPTQIETSTVVSVQNAAFIAITAQWNFRIPIDNPGYVPLGIVLGPGDNAFFQIATDNSDLVWSLRGRERPWRP